MSTTVTFNGSSYSVPANGDSGWGTSLTNYLIAIASGSLQKTGGTFTLTAEVDFGATYGLKSAYVKSRATNPASTGVLRLGNAESIKWRNQANDGDLDLTVNSSDALQFNGNSLPISGSIVNADLSNSAAIAYSKLNLSDSIVNADINASAAIAYSKLNLASSVVNADISNSAAIAYSKLNLSGAIVNADISNSAAIAYSKLNIADNDLTIAKTNGLQSALDAKASLTGDEHISNKRVSYSVEEINTSGSEVTITQTKGALHLINSGLVSIAGIVNSSLASGDSLVLVNRTGNPVNILDGSGAANTGEAIRTGTGGDFVLNNNASIILNYHSTGGHWYMVGGGAGSGVGGINYIDAYNADSGTTGWVRYNDSSETPVDGTGGSANSTWTAATGDDLRESKYFAWTKSGSANRQGEGVRYAFTIDKADRGKVLQGSFDYKIVSGTYASDDMAVWIYDVTNAKLIQPAPYLIKNHSLPSERYFFEFQTSIDSVSYRLLIHTKSASTQNYVLGFDNIILGPQAKMYGSPVTDAIAYTTTFAGGGSASFTPNTVNYWRNGDRCQGIIQGTFSGVGSGTSNLTWTLPAGLSVDTSKMNIGGGALTGISGIARFYNVVGASATYITSSVAPLTATTLAIIKPATSSYYQGGDIIASSTEVEIYFDVPILGWSSSQLLSQDANTRAVVARYTSTSSSAIPDSATVFDFGTKVIDTHNAVTTGASWKFTAPVWGFYRVSANVNYTASSSASRNDFILRKNGSTYKSFFKTTSGATVETNQVNEIVELNAGDYIDFTNFETVNGGTYTNAHSVSIEKIDGPSQILASETVGARYYSTAGTTIPNTEANYLPATKDYDYTNSYNTSTGYTCPVSGLYQVNIQYITASYSTNSILVVRIQQNGTNKASGTAVVPTGIGGNYMVQTSCVIRCLAGDVIKGRHLTTGGTPAQDGLATSNFFEIVRIGNY